MINVVVSMYIKEDCVDKFLTLVKEAVEKTNALDSGCIKYELRRDLNDPFHFFMLEEWEDQASLDAHMQAPHFTELIPQLDKLMTAPPAPAIVEKVF